MIAVAKSCKALLHSNSSLKSGLYTIYPNGVQALKVYCDMEMEGGGWTLAWSFRYTHYESGFTSGPSALSPRPSWPGNGDITLSTTPPLNETNYNAMEYQMWRLLAGEEVL